MQPNQPTAPAQPTKACNHKIIIIILAITTLGALGFAGFEFWQNHKKDFAHEIGEPANCQAMLSDLEKEIEDPQSILPHTPYIFEFRDVVAEPPVAAVTINLDYQTLELTVTKGAACGQLDCGDGEDCYVCTGDGINKVTLSVEEAVKFFKIETDRRYDREAAIYALMEIAIGDQVYKTAAEEGDAWTSEFGYGKYDSNKDGILTHHEYGYAQLNSLTPQKIAD